MHSLIPWDTTFGILFWVHLKSLSSQATEVQSATASHVLHTSHHLGGALQPGCAGEGGTHLTIQEATYSRRRVGIALVVGKGG